MTKTSRYRDYIERVRAAIPLETLLVQHYHRAVQDRFTLCPFHADSNPSCSITDIVFHCFACKAGGDTFHMVQQLEGCTFPQAVDKVAEFAGIPRYRPLAGDAEGVLAKRDVADVTEVAATYYERSLTDEAKTYLWETRGLPRAVTEAARCGWADGQFSSFFASQIGNPQRVIQAGLAMEAKNAATWTGAPAQRDLLRDRVTFPVLRAGRAMFLSGRTIRHDDVGPKYLHQKGRSAPLYNPEALKHGVVVVVEGQIDALSLLAWGVPAVGLLGSALHAGVVEPLRRMATVYACLDPDPSGWAAALKLAMALGPKRVRMMTLPSGKDPNDLYRSAPRALFIRLLDEAVDPVTYLLRGIDRATLDPGEMGDAFTPLFELFGTLLPVDVHLYLAGPVTAWAKGDRRLVKAVEGSWKAHQAGPVRCPGCGLVWTPLLRTRSVTPTLALPRSAGPPYNVSVDLRPGRIPLPRR